MSTVVSQTETLEQLVAALEKTAKLLQFADDHWPQEPDMYGQLYRLIRQVEDEKAQAALFMIATLLLNIMRRSAYCFIARNEKEFAKAYRQNHGRDLNYKEMIREHDDLISRGRGYADGAQQNGGEQRETPAHLKELAARANEYPRGWPRMAYLLETITDEQCDDIDEVYTALFESEE